MRSLLAALVLFCTSPAFAETVAGKPRIVDGDTLDIGATAIRLLGIDAPEVAQPGGRDATSALANLVDGKPITCAGDERDDYGRLIARCWVDGRDVGAAMVRDGYAWAFVKYSSVYVSEEKEARSQHRAIWRGKPEPPWEYRAHRWEVEQQVAPNGCPIKGNIGRHGEHIYHAPWSPWYRKTSVDEKKGERWFCSERDALHAGWRPPYWH